MKTFVHANIEIELTGSNMQYVLYFGRKILNLLTSKVKISEGIKKFYLQNHKLLPDNKHHRYIKGMAATRHNVFVVLCQ